MNLRRSSGIFVWVILMAMVTLVACAEETTVAATDSPAAVSILQPAMPQPAMQNETDTQWVWGEIVSLDNQAKTLTLKYLDYETDQEKDLVLIVDEKTTYENIKSFDEIKLKDTLSVDYATDIENKNIAKHISLERPEGLSSVSAQVDNTKPVDASSVPEQPTVNVVQPAAPTETLEPVPAQALSETGKDAKSSVAVTETAESAPATQGQAQ